MNRAHALLRHHLPLLLAALLCVQTLGLVHRVLHARAVPAVASAEADFGHAAGDADCRILDQLAHADLAFGLAVPVVVASRPLPPATRLPAGRLAAQASGYLARGPPPSVRT